VTVGIERADVVFFMRVVGVAEIVVHRDGLAAFNGVALLIAFILCSRPMPTHTAARAVHLHPRRALAGVIDL
jgi:hypothetical protein